MTIHPTLAVRCDRGGHGGLWGVGTHEIEDHETEALTMAFAGRGDDVTMSKARGRLARGARRFAAAANDDSGAAFAAFVSSNGASSGAAAGGRAAAGGGGSGAG
jgi:hypothetical protein